MANVSPWIEALKKQNYSEVSSDLKTDVTVIGAGIAGCTTAYYLLRDTNKKIILLDAGKIAHGATGHNAGQIASYMERPFASLVKEFGLKKAAQAQLDILGGWDLLDHIASTVNLTQKPESFTGFACVYDIDHLLNHLQNQYLRYKANIRMDFTYVCNDNRITRRIPKKYRHLYSKIEPSEISEKSHSKKKAIAILTTRKGILNSALFCQDVITYLLRKYPKRFKVFEHTPVSSVFIEKKSLEVDTLEYTIFSKNVVLCTNGFRQVKIIHPTKKLLQVNEIVQGTVGHMSGFSIKKAKPCAISYIQSQNSQAIVEPYYYLTLRPHNNKSLICIGGPEKELSNIEEYDRNRTYCPLATNQILSFLKTTTFPSPSKKPKYSWEGLMGYTKTKVRCAGKHPQFSQLYYNVGCNGVGILASLAGSKRVSLLLKGTKLKPSLFDPKHSFKKTV